MEKSTFEARDPCTRNEITLSGEKKFLGVERRKSHRRSYKERRLEIRFDMGTTERRKSAGRRADDLNPSLFR